MNINLSNWSEHDYSDFVVYLKSIEDIKYKEFNSKLIPNTAKEKMIGIRMPVIKKIAKEISKGNYCSFLEVCKCNYYEEIMIRGLVIGLIKTSDYDEFCSLLKSHIKYIDNWALCDSFCNNLKETNKYKKQLIKDIPKFIKSSNPWEIRVAIVLLLSYYLDDEYISKALKLTDMADCDHYYVSMAKAWLVATAFAKNCQITMKFFKNCMFDDITYNRTIQKAKESYRIDDELKQKLAKMKRNIDKN